jgi:hypothetical protein
VHQKEDEPTTQDNRDPEHHAISDRTIHSITMSSDPPHTKFDCLNCVIERDEHGARFHRALTEADKFVRHLDEL